MKFKNNLFYFLLLSLLNFLACEGTVSPIHNIVYYNSFEDVSDLKGWEGLSADGLVDDTAPTGGAHSIRVSGGCIIPTSKLTLAARDENLTVRVTCLAKAEFFSGVVTMFTGKDYEDEIFISIMDTVWRQYQSDKKMFWPANTTLSICINSGGFMGGSMLVDELMIIEE